MDICKLYVSTYVRMYACRLCIIVYKFMHVFVCRWAHGRVVG
jgi:hypothetical protein